MSWSSFNEWELQSMDGSINEYTTTAARSGLSPGTDFDSYSINTPSGVVDTHPQHITGHSHHHGSGSGSGLVFQDSTTFHLGHNPHHDTSTGTSPSASSNGGLSYQSPSQRLGPQMQSQMQSQIQTQMQSQIQIHGHGHVGQPHTDHQQQRNYSPQQQTAILDPSHTSSNPKSNPITTPKANGEALHSALMNPPQSPPTTQNDMNDMHQSLHAHMSGSGSGSGSASGPFIISPPPMASLNQHHQLMTSNSASSSTTNTNNTTTKSPPRLSNMDIISSEDLAKIPPSVLFSTNAIKARPCDMCRHRKARCVLEKGSTKCTYCESKNLTCTFVKGPRPRKKSSGTSTSNLNIDSNNNSHVTSTAERRKRLSNETTSDGEQDESNSIRNVRPVQDYSTLRGHSLLKKTMSLQYPRSSVYLGVTSIYDSRLFDLATFDKLDQTALTNEISVRRPADDIYFALNNDDTYEIAIEDTDAIERIIAPHGKSLIDLYFRIVHPSFPILHKKVFLEKYSRTHREFSAPLLAAVYILALNWWYYDPELSSLPKPDVGKLRKMAQSTFNKVLEHPKLSSVQAGLLLLQCGPNNARSWSICSQVTALSEELGLGLNCQNWRIPRWERGLRRRLAWAVYLQDKWLSLIEARPSHITCQNWLVKRLTSDDFPETAADDSSQEGSADIEDGKLLFVEMVNLGEIVDEILNTLFTLEAKQNIRNTEETLRYSKPIQIKLKRWYQRLPEPLKMVNTKPRRLSSNGYLHLAYFAAEITLHRRIIRTLKPDSSQELVGVCREAARERLVAALEFVKSLRPEHIQSFWHFSAPANFALIGTFAAILHVTAVSREESEFYKNQLSEYLWTLRVSSGFPQMAAALQMLTVATSSIPGLKSDTGNQSQGQSQNQKHEIMRMKKENDEEDEDEDDSDNEANDNVYELDAQENGN